MIEMAGNLWTFHTQGRWVVITTNGSIRKDGWAVMGRGVAQEAARKFPDLSRELGRALQLTGNHVRAFPELRLLTFPVKHTWWERADPGLIRRSAGELIREVERERLSRVYLVRPGCGNGRLLWADVRPALESLLDERFVVVERKA